MGVAAGMRAPREHSRERTKRGWAMGCALGRVLGAVQSRGSACRERAPRRALRCRAVADFWPLPPPMVVAAGDAGVVEGASRFGPAGRGGRRAGLGTRRAARRSGALRAPPGCWSQAAVRRGIPAPRIAGWQGREVPAAPGLRGGRGRRGGLVALAHLAGDGCGINDGVERQIVVAQKMNPTGGQVTLTGSVFWLLTSTREAPPRGTPGLAVFDCVCGPLPPEHVPRPG